jgi:NAD+ dependent glucose-6-phosphate dehydrogenase
MARPKVLITGASGLVGGLAIRHLADRYDLSGLSRRAVPGIPCVEASVDDLEAIRPAFEGVEMVLHLAADTADDWDWEGQIGTTGIGTINVLRAAQEAGVWRVVIMSSGSTMLGYEWDEGSPYGQLALGTRAELGDAPLIDQTWPVRPDSAYGVAKVLAEVAGRFFADWYGMSIPVIRLGAVLAEDRPTLVRQFPGFLSQADAVQIIEACLAAPRSLRYEIFDALSENSNRWRDTDPAKRLLGWKPTGSADAFDAAALGEPQLERDPRWPPVR